MAKWIAALVAVLALPHASEGLASQPQPGNPKQSAQDMAKLKYVPPLDPSLTTTIPAKPPPPPSDPSNPTPTIATPDPIRHGTPGLAC